MVAPVFTGEELESLRRFPEIGREDLFRFFTLTPADSAFIAVQPVPLCRLRYGGSVRSFGFAIYSAARDRYQDAVLRTGRLNRAMSSAAPGRIAVTVVPSRMSMPRRRSSRRV